MSQTSSKPFPWPELALRLDVSQRTLQRIMARELSLSPREVLMRMRVERARGLLMDPTARVADVACACGFASQAHFCTAFRHAVGVTPAAYRRRNAGAAPVPD